MKELKNKYLITFSGLDGSGKSSIIKAIRDELNNAIVISIIDFRLANRIKRKIKSDGNTKKNYDRKPYLFLNTFLLIIDILIFNIYYTLFCGTKILICDRYFSDLLISIEYRHKKYLFFSFIKKIIIQPDLSFFLDVEPEVGYKREEGDVHSLDYFKEKSNLYRNHIVDFNYIIIYNRINALDATIDKIENKLKDITRKP